MRLRAERGFRFLRGPLPGLSAKAEHAADGSRHVLQRFLAVLRVVQRARRRFLQRKQIELGHVVDVYVGPDILAHADVQADGSFACVLDQRRHLGALLARAAAFAIDHGGTYHHRAHALRRGIEHDLVDRCPLLHARYGGSKAGVFVVDRVSAFAARYRGDDSRPAGMQERLPGTAQRGCNGFHYAGVVRFGRVDDGIGCARGACNHVGIVKTAEHAAHAPGFELLCAGFGAHETCDGMALAQKTFGHRPADIACCPVRNIFIAVPRK